jgi:hypothetical protein
MDFCAGDGRRRNAVRRFFSPADRGALVVAGAPARTPAFLLIHR